MSQEQFNFEIVKLIIAVLGTLLVAYQLHRGAVATAGTHEWNRRRATQDAINDFLSPEIQQHWNKLYAPVINNGNKYADLSDEEKESVRAILTFLEGVGVLIKHHIVEEDVMFDLLGGVWPTLYKCSEKFIIDYRSLRKDESVFEQFVHYADNFVKIDDGLRKKRKEGGALPPKPRLK